MNTARRSEVYEVTPSSVGSGTLPSHRNSPLESSSIGEQRNWKPSPSLGSCSQLRPSSCERSTYISGRCVPTVPGSGSGIRAQAPSQRLPSPVCTRFSGPPVSHAPGRRKPTTQGTLQLRPPSRERAATVRPKEQ